MDEGMEPDRLENGHALKSALPRTWGAFFGRHGNFTPAQLAAIPPLLAGENVLLCAPTASGKTEAALAPLIERHLSLSGRTEYTPADGRWTMDDGRTQSPASSTVHRPSSIVHRPSSLTILYLLPTRALISDLCARLAAPLERLRVSFAVKTHDFTTFDPKRPADLLLTTPESLDALLASQAKILAGVRAVVIDELHVFDGTPRGDQLRVVLNRLRQVRAHAARVGDATDDSLQLAALSATLTQPEAAATRFLASAKVVRASGHRTIQAEQIALAVPDDGRWTMDDSEESSIVHRPSSITTDALLNYLSDFRKRGWRKALAFCNTRSEVETYAAAVRAAGSPFGDAVYAHYSNLAWERRREIEQQFAQAQAAICFASSTLELGIDIGNIDVALLIGAPGSIEAFVQRTGRAGRRQPVARVACFYRTPLERITFDALIRAESPGSKVQGPKSNINGIGPSILDPGPWTAGVEQATSERDAATSSHFHPSVAIQQIFSLLKQSPTGAVRLNPLAGLFAGMLSADDLRAIMGTLQALGYLQSGRAGEWRAGEQLNQLADLQSAEYTPLSLHSNIPTSGSKPIKIRDRYSQRVVASVDRQWFDRDQLTLEGRPMSIEWYDGESLWVSAQRGHDTEDVPARLRYLSTRQILSYDLARRFPPVLGLPPATAPLVQQDNGLVWFHWLGDVYGRAALDLVKYTMPAMETPEPGLCLLLQDVGDARGGSGLRAAILSWTHEQVVHYLHDKYRRYEPMLALGAYHHLLPVELRRRAVVEQFDVPRFLQAVENLNIGHAGEAPTEELGDFINGIG